MAMLDVLRDRIAAATSACDQLSEEHIWSAHGTLVWKAKRFVGAPSFYPVYQCEGSYSYSPLALILTKGRLVLNPLVQRAASDPEFLYYSGNETIDREITRVGGPLPRSSGEAVTDPDRYAEEIVRALNADLSAAQERHPTKRNVVLCGGKDSLNLLLAPWKRPVVALSAPPNYEHVREFVRANDLPHEVRQLDDPRDDAVIEQEILETCCRATLEHYRWGAHLVSIAREYQGELIYWKGQLGDTFMTPYWKAFCHPPAGLRRKVHRAYGLAEPLLPRGLRARVAHDVLEPYFRHTLWIRGAMFQGSHMSVIRNVANCLVLSAYHGAEMSRLLPRVDLFSAVTEDIRPRVGRLLLGREVRYPTANPGPAPSSFRRGLSHPDRLLELLAREGLPLERRL
jgi:hypothetical protein